jgi:hypothetical protein
MGEDRMSKKATKSAEQAAFQAELDEQIARMREMLKLMAPGTGATALGAMREAFPDASLQDRVRALKDYR